jgi:pimeloyl-ACP methyl ester carboxylesterase
MKKLLIVTVPGLSGNSGPWREMAAELHRLGTFDNQEVVWHYFETDVGIFGRVPLLEISRRLGAEVAMRWTADNGYDEIILVGHSLGALVVRRAWLDAVDPTQFATYTGSDWGQKVVRFVLFAGISRGVDMEHPWGRRLSGRLIEWIPGRFTTEDCVRGSAFVTNLRISWIQYMASLPNARRPNTIQLLGTKDSIVTRDDSIDLDVFPDTRPLYIPGAGHADVHELRGHSDRAGRLALFARAFTEPTATLRQPRESSDTPPPEVLMVVHGIRASRTDNWVRRVVQIAAEHWPEVAVATPTYGYLSAMRFALPSVRRRYARFFRDFYTEVVAAYRRPKISVLCHSNGTYALGRSLQEFQSIRIARVALAGSVLPTNFPWSQLAASHRVEAVRNDCGSRDYPVALLCSALRGIGMRDIGTGGFDGFLGGTVQEFRFHPGGHGCMLTDSNLRSILRFALDCSDHEAPADLIDNVAVTRTWSRAVPRLGILLLIAVAATSVLGAYRWGLLFGVAELIAVLGAFFVLDIV